MFTSSLKRERGHFAVVAVQWRKRNVQKCVMHVQICCFARSTYCFFDVLVVVAVMASCSQFFRHGTWNYLPMIKSQLCVKQNCLPSISYQTLQTSKMNFENLLGEHVFKNNNCVLLVFFNFAYPCFLLYWLRWLYLRRMFWAVILLFHVAGEKSQHFATPPLVSPRNDVWEMNAEIPYWWRVTTQIWEVFLIGRAAWEILFNQSKALPISR